MTRAFLRAATRGGFEGEGRLAWWVLIGTIPVGACGLVVDRLAGDALRSALVIAVATIAFGILLWWADRAGRRERDEYSLGLRDVIVIGCAQALALIPGTSRSGITMTAALMLGLNREAAARFSFLLSIPVIVLAGALKTLDLATSADPVPWVTMSAAAALAALCAYTVIHFFLEWIGRVGMWPFLVYRLLLGALLLTVFAF